MSSKLPSPPKPASAGATSTNAAAAAAAMNPADIAREAFRRLATRRIAPTPSAYRDIYNEIAGISEPADTPAAPAAVLAASANVEKGAESGAENVLTQF